MSEGKILVGLKKVIQGKDLSMYESENVMREIMSGKVTDAQLGAFLVALNMKKESIEEITGFAKVMREFANKIEPKVGLVLSMNMERDGVTHQVPATIVEVSNDMVTVDYNHPLAGHPLNYEVKVLGVK